MLQKDYILRMVEMLGELIAAILGLIKKGEFPKAEQSLEKLYYDFLKQDASFFRSIPKEKLTEKLIGEHNYTNGHLEILAELFYVEAELQYAKRDKEISADFYEKSVHLFEFIDSESKTFSTEHQNKIIAIKKRIKKFV
jgi:hypothetical protein